MSNLALGTVQFGLNYGVSNLAGQPSSIEVQNIVKCAFENQISILDTAMTYGASEKILGDCGVSKFHIVTKLPPLDSFENLTPNTLFTLVEDSLKRLKIDKIYGLLMHRSSDLTGPRGTLIYDVIQNLKDEGKLINFGVSIYDPQSLEKIMDNYKVDLVQAPINVLDRRMEESGWLKKLHDAHIEVHSRSTFLQGLLLMRLDNLPARFKRWSHIFSSWNEFLKKNKVSALDACLSYPLSLTEISNVIVGVQTRKEIEELIKLERKLTRLDTSFMSCNDLNLVDPSRW
jgi:aryl-alcohol dehydrogenase-like predicted oxidoreductase